MKILLIILIFLAVFVILEGIVLKNLLREYQKSELERKLLEDIISERFQAYEESIDQREFPYGNRTGEGLLG